VQVEVPVAVHVPDGQPHPEHVEVERGLGAVVQLPDTLAIGAARVVEEQVRRDRWVLGREVVDDVEVQPAVVV
jgi:hypothetical protein